MRRRLQVGGWSADDLGWRQEAMKAPPIERPSSGWSPWIASTRYSPRVGADAVLDQCAVQPNAGGSVALQTPLPAGLTRGGPRICRCHGRCPASVLIRHRISEASANRARPPEKSALRRAGGCRRRGADRALWRTARPDRARPGRRARRPRHRSRSAPRAA
jgi:hypothetical protein